MKRIPLLLTAAAAALFCGAPASHATITITPTSATANQYATPGSTFNVTLSLSVTQNTSPSNVAGFDLYVVTASANSGLFAITNATGLNGFTLSGPDDSTPDQLNVAAANGFVRNGMDQAFSTSISGAKTTPFTGAIETLTFSIASNAVLGTTYTFQTSTVTNAGTTYYSDINDTAGNVYATDGPGTFTITVVPEPSTYMATGALVLGAFGLAIRRRKLALAK